MSNYTIRTGFWYDHTHSNILGATLTLEMAWGNRLVSALTTAVTISGSCFWIILAFALHQTIIIGHNTDVLGLQHGVMLRNSGSASGTLWDLTKSWRAWRQGTRKVWLRSLALIIPALVVWLGFLAAGILVSDVASKSYTGVQVLLEPSECGYWIYDSSSNANSLANGAVRMLQDTFNARAYAANWYGNTSSVLAASSLFPQARLPYSTKVNTSCPINPERCWSSGFTMITPPLDSHVMLGINAPSSNRVQFQKTVTCAVVETEDFVEEVGNTLYYMYGPGRPNNWTYMYYMPLWNSTVAYVLE
jgi:hypothetical protein